MREEADAPDVAGVVEPDRTATASAPVPDDVFPQAPPAYVPPPPQEDAEPSFVYALGHIDARYPSLGVEREFAQAAALIDTAHLDERQILKRIIDDDDNRYLARSLCWLFLVAGVETYILVPRDPADYTALINAYRAKPPSTDDVDVVIGVRGPIAPPEACNGVAVPIVAFDQTYSFTRKEFVEAIPAPAGATRAVQSRFRESADSTFERIMNLSDNAGAIDEHRALNYLAVRYPRLYAVVAEAHGRSQSLTGIEVLSSPLSGVRKIVEIVLSFTDRQTDVVEKQFARVDVTERFPFLVTKLGSYYDR